MFNDKLFKQIEGLGMGLPLGPSFANIFIIIILYYIFYYYYIIIYIIFPSDQSLLPIKRHLTN